MPELIDRLETIQRIKNDFCSECECECGGTSCRVCEYDFCIGILNEMPTIEAEPVRNGRWIQRRNEEYYCSNCGREERFIFQKNYCPKCGTRIDGGE